MIPKHYPCNVFFGPTEWAFEGMRYGASSIICHSPDEFYSFRRLTMVPCHFSVRAVAYFVEEPTTS